MTWPATILLPALLATTTPANTSNEAQIIFAGDAMMHQAQLDASLRSDGTYDFSQCFSALADEIKAADYAVVNLETPISAPPYSGYPCFNAPKEYAEALKETGFDLMLTANNHTLDRRNVGLISTISILDSLDIAHIGTYQSADKRKEAIPAIHNIAGFKVGFLNYTYGTNGFEARPPVVADRIDRKIMAADIEATRRSGAEIIAVCIHWGEEYILLPNKFQRDMTQWLLDQDVDMIIGSHPHVIQPMEITTNKSGRRALTVYSLGNLISNMRTPDTRGGAILRASLKRDSTGKATVTSAAYRLVIVEAGKHGTPFRVLPADADSLMSQTTRFHRDNFVRNARKIFDGHNVGVTDDTLRLTERWGKKRRPLLMPLQPHRPTPTQILQPPIILKKFFPQNGQANFAK